jgi:hypothetical protein
MYRPHRLLRKGIIHYMIAIEEEKATADTAHN